MAFANSMEKYASGVTYDESNISLMVDTVTLLYN